MLLSRFWFIIALVLLLILAGCQIKTPSHSIRPPLGQEAPASHLGRVFMTSDGLPPRERIEKIAANTDGTHLTFSSHDGYVYLRRPG